jgi:hypothetical protein
VDHSWPIENNVQCLWGIQKDLYCLQVTKLIFTIDDYYYYYYFPRDQKLSPQAWAIKKKLHQSWAIENNLHH